MRTAGGDTVAFLGPSLAQPVAGRRLPARYLPPIRRGDLPAVVGEGARRVVIIDGEFGQSRAVAIYEIRDALQQGVEIWGASSMGALRAAECHRLGMRGVGWIFEAYRDGALTADDEVALLFDPRSGNAVTVPLVNVRWAIERAVREAALEGGEQLVAVARRVPFAERTYDEIARTAPPELRASADALRRFVAADPDGCDRKRLDALAVLDAVRDEVAAVAAREVS